MRIIGLDVGAKRIGVAKADSTTRIAVPMGFIEVDGNEWAELARLARVQGANLFVVGLPRSNEGTETAQSLYARNFAKKLTEVIPRVKVRLQDESLTSVLAESRLKKSKNGYQKGDIDAEAASIILQDFLETFSQKDALSSPESSAPKTKIEQIAANVAESTTNRTKEATDKMKLKSRKAKQRIRNAAKWTSLILFVAVLGFAGFLGVKWYRGNQRAAEYAKIEAEMVPEVFDFTILPGETLSDIKKNLLKVGYTESEIIAALDTDYDFDFLGERPSGASLEGYLYGETHEFYKSASATEVIETFLNEMAEVIQENQLEEKYAVQGLSLFEGITLASIVQKEAPDIEQAGVAQVFLKRLELGIPLGSDVTVSYAVEAVDPERQIYTDNQSALQIDSCYNTRVNTGLPCGPISNPGLSALLAVAEPADTSYLYFLTGDDGLMYYSYTESEHNQNIYSHCQELCNVSL